MLLLKAAFKLILGVVIGLLLLEAVLRANPRLLLRGMALPEPVDPPLDEQIYEVRYSDADLFYWQPDMIQPIPAEQNRLEARVRYVTDEFGFPNQPPLPAHVDIAVLGRSYSLGAQAASPWTRLLVDQYGYRVLNLSQTGSGISTKIDYLQEYGMPRQPRWVILEVLPSMDIIGYEERHTWLVQDLPVPIIQQIARRVSPQTAANTDTAPIYPLSVRLPCQTVELTFFNYYLASLSVDQHMLQDSLQWHRYQQELLELVDLDRSQGACTVLLYAPTKENIYFSMAEDPDQLQPALAGWAPWDLSADGRLVRNPEISADLDEMRANASAARDLLERFAKDHSIPLVDPTAPLVAAQTAGIQPFMTYDTHWSAAGHRIVAELVAQTLRSANCP